MNAFLLTAILAVAVTILALVSTVQTTGKTVWFRFRTIVRATVSARAANLFVITIASCAIVLILAIAFGLIHPWGTNLYGIGQLIQSQRFLAIIFGLLFGVFLVFWIRQLLLLGETDKVTWLHKGEAIFLVLLLLFGVFSEQISSLARRVNQFSAGGVTLTFEALKGSAGIDLGEQGGGGRYQGKVYDALDFLSDIHGDKGILDRDHHYIHGIRQSDCQARDLKDKDRLLDTARAGAGYTNLFSGNCKASRSRIIPYEDPMNDFFAQTIGAIAVCLAEIVHQTRDDLEASDRLRAMKLPMREIMFNHDLTDDRIKSAAGTFVAASQ